MREARTGVFCWVTGLCGNLDETGAFTLFIHCLFWALLPETAVYGNCKESLFFIADEDLSKAEALELLNPCTNPVLFKVEDRLPLVIEPDTWLNDYWCWYLTLYRFLLFIADEFMICFKFFFWPKLVVLSLSRSRDLNCRRVCSNIGSPWFCG